MSNRISLNASFLLLLIISTSSFSSGGSGSKKNDGRNLPPCAACKHSKKPCLVNCIFHPYFPANQQSVFETACSIFGIGKMRSKLKACTTADQRKLMAKSFIYESSIATLRNRIKLLNDELLQLETQYAQFKSASAVDGDEQIPRDDGNANGVPLEESNANANANADSNDRATENQNNDRETANVEILRYNTIAVEFEPSVAVDPLAAFNFPAESLAPSLNVVLNTINTGLGPLPTLYTWFSDFIDEYTPEEIKHFLDTVDENPSVTPLRDFLDDDFGFLDDFSPIPVAEIERLYGPIDELFETTEDELFGTTEQEDPTEKDDETPSQ